METLGLLISLERTLPLFMSFFLSVYILSYTKIFKNWGHKLRHEASSCVMSFCHGTPAVLLSITAILTTSDDEEILTNMASPNTALQSMVLDYSMSYFIIDLLHYILFVPNQALFVAHHLATLFVFLTCRFLVCHGASALLVLLALAEVTSACQNVWTLTRLRMMEDRDKMGGGGGCGGGAGRLYELLSPVFYGFYLVVRGVFGLVFVVKMGVFFVKGGGDGLIPKWVWAAWLLVIWGAVLVSIIWVMNLWVLWFKEMDARRGNKKTD